MSTSRKRAIEALLKAIETGEPGPVAVVDEARYIQHNPQTHEGSEGLAALFERLAKSSPRVNVVRIFSDGDFVFGHTEYDFSTRRIGFEVFRFEGERAVEHWDNIQPRRGPNPAGHSMVDGPTEAGAPEQREPSRALARRLVEEVLIGGAHEQLRALVDADFTEHNPALTDGLDSLEAHLGRRDEQGRPHIEYQRLHRVLADGEFALAVSEGARGGVHTAFYDLFRVHAGKLVEHWDTTEAVPPKSEWKNDNGKF